MTALFTSRALPAGTGPDCAEGPPAGELAHLLYRVSRGDQDAFGSFYDATCQEVFGMVLSVVGDRTRAESVTHDVYVAAWRTAPAFGAARRTPGAWLTAIVGGEIRSLPRLFDEPGPA